MKTQRERNGSPKPYTIPIRKYAKSIAPTVNPINPSYPIPKNKPEQPIQLPTPQPTQKSQTVSEVQQIYTDLQNPLSYSGNADTLLNKVKSYKYVLCFLSTQVLI